MPCYHPLNALWLGNKPDGKKIIGFLGCPVNDNQTKVWYKGRYYDRSRLIQIPCGQCIGCRIDYSRQWANRCMLELQYHDSAYFCTFTYDDDHVPQSWYADPETGEAHPSLTLCKRDFQLLMKRIRKRFSDDSIRFFANRVTGEMRSTYELSLDVWHLADDYSTLPSLSDSWIREDAKTIDRVLAVSSSLSNQFFADIYVRNYCTRPMPMYSVPGLIDHH